MSTFGALSSQAVLALRLYFTELGIGRQVTFAAAPISIHYFRVLGDSGYVLPRCDFWVSLSGAQVYKQSVLLLNE